MDYSVSVKLCRLLKALYASTISAVRVDGELTDWFDVNTGLRQGCMLSPALFNVYIDHVIRIKLIELAREEKKVYGVEWEARRSGVHIEYRMPEKKSSVMSETGSSIQDINRRIINRKRTRYVDLLKHAGKQPLDNYGMLILPVKKSWPRPSNG